MEFDLFREVVFTCFNRRSLKFFLTFLKVKAVIIVWQHMVIAITFASTTVCSYCSMKNNVLL
jgi:hypothetical protein